MTDVATSEPAMIQRVKDRVDRCRRVDRRDSLLDRVMIHLGRDATPSELIAFALELEVYLKAGDVLVREHALGSAFEMAADAEATPAELITLAKEFEAYFSEA